MRNQALHIAATTVCSRAVPLLSGRGISNHSPTALRALDHKEDSSRTCDHPL